MVFLPVRQAAQDVSIVGAPSRGRLFRCDAVSMVRRLPTNRAITKSSTAHVLCVARDETNSKRTVQVNKRSASTAFCRQENKMISTKSKLSVALTVALGVVGAIALAVPSAEARTKHHAAKVHRTASDAFVRQPTFRGSYNYAPPLSSGGINFNDGRNGANYNPNQ
jgi:hypothetical protein